MFRRRRANWRCPLIGSSCNSVDFLFCRIENPKWFLNVQWQMEGVDIHLDVNIGKQLSALGHTLTMLTGVQEDETLTACYDSEDGDDNTNNSQVRRKSYF